LLRESGTEEREREREGGREGGREGEGETDFSIKEANGA
jgi:hypothetical protein